MSAERCVASAKAKLLQVRGQIDAARHALDLVTVPAPSSIPAYGQIALADLLAGVREIPGASSHPRITKALRTTTHPSESDETPWCSAIVNLWMSEAGMPFTRSAAARSWLDWGHPRRGPLEPWDVCVFWRGSKTGRSGHVGLGLAEDRDSIWLLGGNQGNALSLKWYPKTRLLDVRCPQIF